MTNTRILPAVLLVIATAGPAAAQFRMPVYSPPGGPVPSVLPAGVEDGDGQGYGYPGQPPGRPPAAPGMPPAATSLERMNAPQQPGPGTGDPVGTLNAPGYGGLPPGSYASPWYSDGPGCYGPFGRHGPIDYELYTRTGPTITAGGTPLTERLQVGWAVAAGGRSLFFNRAGDAAWVLDLGLSYQYNRGTSVEMLDIFIRQPPQQNAQTGQRIVVPDQLTTSRIRDIQRTAFNFGLGRDWWAWGPGIPGAESGWNFRFGTDLGGRWGTAHVEAVPNGDPTQYARRQKVFEGIYLGGHFNVEVPIGNWVLFGGFRAQWGYDWMNIIPPQKGDIQYIDLLLTSGIRF
jgi:hypothetical protein